MNAPVAFLLSIQIDAEVHQVRIENPTSEMFTCGSEDDLISLSVSSHPRGVIDENDLIEDIADAAAASLKAMIIKVYERAQEVAALEQELGEIDL